MGMTRVLEVGKTDEGLSVASVVMLRVVLDVLARDRFRADFNALLTAILMKPQTEALFKLEAVRSLVRERIPRAEEDGARLPAIVRAHWISFFRLCWVAGAHFEAAELSSALGLDSKNPLTKAEVLILGVDLPADKLLVRLAPTLAIPAFGFKILEEEPEFAKALSAEQLFQITELSAQKDVHWPTIRKVVAEVEPTSSLRLALSLFKASHETRDLDLVSKAYRSVDEFTRKQTWLPLELDRLLKKFGDQIQRDVIDPVVAPDHAICQEISRVTRLTRTPSTSSWVVVEGEAAGGLQPLA
eukprot:NODE_962_length_1291_cov_224.125405.p1 GENE.NODE_962_length_1291_cov_224.125405~~NODE_962_length_1291_cov_224.125405.p1  ORF type:complete len:300 (-),score=75.59 NODE_962_length_1291_cov_224.125405:374-1273(-)